MNGVIQVLILFLIAISVCGLYKGFKVAIWEDDPKSSTRERTRLWFVCIIGGIALPICILFELIKLIYIWIRNLILDK